MLGGERRGNPLTVVDLLGYTWMSLATLLLARDFRRAGLIRRAATGHPSSIDQ